jgi:hypothetical protein
MKPVVSVKELMRDMIDPISDNIFEAVGDEWSKTGTIEHRPRTDEDWDRIRVGAVTMAEGAYLLKVPRPFTPPGDENNSTGPEAEELSPAQIADKLQKDPVLWNAKIEALRNVGLAVLDIVKRKDVDELWDAARKPGSGLRKLSPLEYWYPGERVLLRKLDQRLDDLYGKQRTDRTRPPWDELQIEVDVRGGGSSDPPLPSGLKTRRYVNLETSSKYPTLRPM